MSDVMKRVGAIEAKTDHSDVLYQLKPGLIDGYANDDIYLLISTIKQLHAENERYKKALEYYANESNDFTNKTTATEALEQAAIYKGVSE